MRNQMASLFLNFSCFPCFRKCPCNKKIGNRTMLYFTPLLPSTPRTLFGINSCCSFTNLVCDSAVHIFFFSNCGCCHLYAVCCLLCRHVQCLVFFSLNTYYLRSDFVIFSSMQPSRVLLLVTFSSVRYNIYPFPKISVCLLHLLLKTVTDISELEWVALGRIFPLLHLAS